VSIDVQLEDEFYCDRSLLMTIFQNLIENSEKYKRNRLKIAITVTEKKNNTSIAITDNGSGIAKKAAT